MISAIILAAGKSLRMGFPKLLLPIEGKSLLQHVIDSTLKSKVDDVVVVLGAEAAKLKREIKPGKARIIVNTSYDEGQSTSLRAGLQSINPESRAVIILLGDQPFINKATINALVDKYQESGSPVVAPVYNGKRGNPVLFDRALIPELIDARGDQGGRKIVEKYTDRIATIEIDSAIVGIDIDTWDDYQKMSRFFQAGD